ncbi:MAG: hypothetical protein GTO41_13700 [Burkholderiales bacterium]|nr:hypothetical protein [Burkholderiales bacterium]
MSRSRDCACTCTNQAHSAHTSQRHSQTYRARRATASPCACRRRSAGEFATASIRLVNESLPAAKANVDPDYPQELVARNGLVSSDSSPIKPGQPKQMRSANS